MVEKYVLAQRVEMLILRQIGKLSDFGGPSLKTPVSRINIITLNNIYILASK